MSDQARAVLSEEEKVELRRKAEKATDLDRTVMFDGEVEIYRLDGDTDPLTEADVLLAAACTKAAVLSQLNELEETERDLAVMVRSHSEAEENCDEAIARAEKAEAELDQLKQQLVGKVNWRLAQALQRINDLGGELADILSAYKSAALSTPIPAATGEVRTPGTFDPDDYPYDHARSGDPNLRAHRRSTDPLHPKQVSP